MVIKYEKICVLKEKVKMKVKKRKVKKILENLCNIENKDVFWILWEVIWEAVGFFKKKKDIVLKQKIVQNRIRTYDPKVFNLMLLT